MTSSGAKSDGHGEAKSAWQKHKVSEIWELLVRGHDEGLIGLRKQTRLATSTGKKHNVNQSTGIYIYFGWASNEPASASPLAGVMGY